MRAALFSLGSVALVTGAVYALRPVAPVLSLGVLYLFAVLPVAALWGLSYAVGVSVVSMLAFNFLFLPHAHLDSRTRRTGWHWRVPRHPVCVSELAAHARRRRPKPKLARASGLWRFEERRRQDRNPPFRQSRPAIADHRDHDGERRTQARRRAVA
jgi:two-component system sensor histidine kinase KdpD